MRSEITYLFWLSCFFHSCACPPIFRPSHPSVHQSVHPSARPPVSIHRSFCLRPPVEPGVQQGGLGAAVADPGDGRHVRGRLPPHQPGRQVREKVDALGLSPGPPHGHHGHGLHAHLRQLHRHQVHRRRLSAGERSPKGLRVSLYNSRLFRSACKQIQQPPV